MYLSCSHVNLNQQVIIFPQRERSFSFKSKEGYTVEPLWKGQESITNIAKFGPFPRTIL